MTLRWIPLADLEPHPENSNRMPDRLLAKLRQHIERTGLYEPLVVRPLPAPAGAEAARHVEGALAPDAPAPDQALPGAAAPPDAPAPVGGRYQILNGHHRARVLGDLGHTHARCDVWAVGDADARLLLATLNRLEGRDDPAARARLVARLASGPGGADLARLLPEPPDAVERLRRLAERPPGPAAPEDAVPPARPMTFFLADEPYALVAEALREVARDSGADGSAAGAGLKRADALERLAQWYLESRSLR